MTKSAINLTEKLTLFSEHWSPKIIAQMNDYHFKLVKFQGRFTWHSHEDTDETFICLDGNMVIEFEDEIVEMAKGDLFVVPKGRTHRPVAETECKVLLVEPAGVINTGDNPGSMTAANDVWI